MWRFERNDDRSWWDAIRLVLIGLWPLWLVVLILVCDALAPR